MKVFRYKLYSRTLMHSILGRDISLFLFLHLSPPLELNSSNSSILILQKDVNSWKNIWFWTISADAWEERCYCQGVGVWIICCSVALSCHLTPHSEQSRSRGSWHEAVSLPLSSISPAFTGYCDFSLWDGSGRQRHVSMDDRLRERLCAAASVGLLAAQLQRLFEISTFPCYSDCVLLLHFVSSFSCLRHHGRKVDVGPAV